MFAYDGWRWPKKLRPKTQTETLWMNLVLTEPIATVWWRSRVIALCEYLCRFTPSRTPIRFEAPADGSETGEWDFFWKRFPAFPVTSKWTKSRYCFHQFRLRSYREGIRKAGRKIYPNRTPLIVGDPKLLFRRGNMMFSSRLLRPQFVREKRYARLKEQRMPTLWRADLSSLDSWRAKSRSR